jgi:magnesium transporter
MATEVLDPEEIQARLDRGEFFWLDLHQPDAEDFDLLRRVFGFHPLAVEDSEHFGQRPKCELYDDFVFLVLFGAAPPPDEDRLVEMHCFYSERFLVTVRGDESPTCDRLRSRHAREGTPEAIFVLHQLADGLVDSFFDALADFDERIDTLQEEVAAGPTDAQLLELSHMRSRLARFRRIVAPQRDLFAQFIAGVTPLPGMTPEAERYFRDVYDHLIRVSEQIDSYRELLTGSMDVYLSTVSNRLNVVTKQLALIATIALPLIVISGFFGQNFTWMVDHVDSWVAFLVLGVGLQVASLVLLVLYFKRRGWF